METLEKSSTFSAGHLTGMGLLMGRLTMFDEVVWKQFVQPGEVTEVRIPKVSGNSSAWDGYAKGTVTGYFDDHSAFCRAVKMADKAKHHGIYFTLQVVDPRLIGRAFNRLKATDRATSDANVIAYRWLPIDTDPKRPSGISASDDELKKALKVRDEIAEWVTSEMGLKEPIRAMSGPSSTYFTVTCAYSPACYDLAANDKAIKRE